MKKRATPQLAFDFVATPPEEREAPPPSPPSATATSSPAAASARAHPLERFPAPASPEPSAAIVFVVPTARHVERFLVAGYSALTFGSLEERLLASLSGLSVATRANERLALAEALEEGRFAIPGGTTRLSRYVTAVLGALDDLARDVGPLEAARGSAPPVFAGRIAELARLSSRFDARLEALGLVAERNVARSLARSVARASYGEVVAALGARAVESRLVLELSPGRLTLLAELEKKLAPEGGRATVCLPMFDRPFDPERVPDPLETVATWVLPRLSDAPRTVPLEPRLGVLDGVTSPSRELAADVDVVLAASLESEAHAVAAEVRAALASGARVEAVAVGYGTRNEAFLAELGRAFEAAEVVAHGVPETRSLLPALVEDLRRALEEPSSRARAKVLASPFVDLGLPKGEGGRRLASVAKVVSVAPDVREEHGLAAKRTIERARRPGAAGDSARARDLRIWQRLADVLDAFPAEGSMAEFVTAFARVLGELGVGRRAVRARRDLFERDDLSPHDRLEARALAADARAYAALEAALTELERAWQRNVQVFDSTRFFDELFAVYDPSPSLPGASRTLAVRVAKLADLADEDLDLLVVPLATSRGLGGGGPRSPLLSVELLGALGHDANAASARSLGALALAASRASKVVLTATATTDDEGDDEVHPAVTALVDAGARRRSFGHTSRLSSPLSPLDARVLALLEGGEPSDPALRARVDTERTREAFFLDEKRPVSPPIGLVEGAPLTALEAETGAHKPLPLTGLERLAECAFRGFSHVVLGAREPMEGEDLPTAREEGTRLHGALAEALTAAKPLLEARPPVPSEVVRIGLARAEAYLAEVRTAAPLEAILDARVLDVARRVLEDAAADPDWVFAFAEKAFGENEPLAWPALSLGEGELLLRGRIDRVDVGRVTASARVVDYKRGSLEGMRAKVGATALQVPLYALAARAALGRADVTGIYFSLRDEVLARPNEKDRCADVVAQQIEGAIEVRALDVVRRVRRGDVTPRPEDELSCRTCPFSGGCRRPRFAMPAEEDDGRPGGEA